MNREDRLVYSVKEMAELLGVGRSTAYELVTIRVNSVTPFRATDSNSKDSIAAVAGWVRTCQQ